MKRSNIEFITFSIKQAIEAEEYGFTRNECCRNLKLSLHQHWQNKTLGYHGQSQKKNISRSKKAKEKDLKECDVEHVVPMMIIVNILMDMKPINKDKIEDVLKKYFRVLVVTKEEHKKLNSSGLGSKMPNNWDGRDVGMV